MKLLVVAAWEPELERFRSLAPSVSGPAIGLDLNIDAVGIGLVDATLGMTRCVQRYRPTHVLFLGTAGANPRASLSIGDVVVANSVRLVDPTTVEGRAALPYAAEALSFDPSMVESLFNSGARPVQVVNPLGVTIDDALALKLGALGEVEHLESYAVARACHLASIPCAIALGIANKVGARGREEWRANHVAASARVAEVVDASIRRSIASRTRA